MGEGGFGKVYYGRWCELDVAIKVLAPDAWMRANVVDEFRREVGGVGRDACLGARCWNSTLMLCDVIYCDVGGRR